MTNTVRTEDLSRRYKDILDTTKNTFKVDIIGAGTIGSNLAICLSRMGVELHIWDFDEVEAHNLGHQNFRVKDIGVNKATAMKDIIKEAIGDCVKVVAHPVAYTGGRADILILACDSLKARQEVYKNTQFKILIDGRMGGEQISMRTCYWLSRKTYEDDLFEDITPSPLPCGGRSIGYTSFAVASLLAKQVARVINGEPLQNADYDLDGNAMQVW